MVVGGFDIAEESGPGIGGVDEAAVLEHFGFQGTHEGFRPKIMIGIGPGGPALVDTAAGRAAGVQGLAEGMGDEPGTEVAGDHPADNPEGAETTHHSQIEPAFGGWDISDIAGPHLVPSFGKGAL